MRLLPIVLSLVSIITCDTLSAQRPLSDDEVQQRFRYISWDNVEMSNRYLGTVEATADVSFKAPTHMSQLEVTDSGSVIGVFTNGSNSSKSDKIHIGYIASGESYTQITEFKLTHDESENLRRLQLKRFIEGIALTPDNSLCFLSDAHINKFELSKPHTVSKGSISMNHIVDIESTASDKDSLILMFDEKTSYWRDGITRPRGIFNDFTEPTYPDAKEIYETYISKQKFGQFSGKAEGYMIVINGDDYRPSAFCFLDDNRVLVLLHIEKRNSTNRWFPPQPAILLIDRTRKGFFLVNGIKAPKSIDANPAAEKDALYVLSSGKLTRYKIAPTSDESWENSQDGPGYKIITGGSATKD
ncbi:MAG: hypothetical protein ACSHX8_15730 [Opitutaceae bacterium]